MSEFQEGYLFGLWIAAMVCDVNAGPKKASANAMDIMKLRATEKEKLDKGEELQFLPEMSKAA